MSQHDEEKAVSSEMDGEKPVGRRTSADAGIFRDGRYGRRVDRSVDSSSRRTDHTDPTRVPGHAPSPYGSRAPRETAQRLTTATHSLTPHQSLHGIITPSALHFERHHNGVPAIDSDRHRLLIHGLVERPLTLSMHDLTQFPSVTRTLFIECSGNSGKEWTGLHGNTVQDTHGLMSASEWTGVLLATVLSEAGRQA